MRKPHETKIPNTGNIVPAHESPKVASVQLQRLALGTNLVELDTLQEVVVLRLGVHVYMQVDDLHAVHAGAHVVVQGQHDTLLNGILEIFIGLGQQRLREISATIRVLHERVAQLYLFLFKHVY
jgi:hypothetical protein